jgi:hypothetical protein
MGRPLVGSGACLVVLMALAGCGPQDPVLPQDAELLRRGQSRREGGVTVTITALNPGEARSLLGFDVAGAGVQPVWVKVVNREGKRWFLPPISIDNEYYSPLEVAWIGHRLFRAEANRRIDAHLSRLALAASVEPFGVVSGFVFTNLDEGIKYANFELVSPDAQQPQLRRFSFLAEVPGHSTDFQKVNWSGLYPSAKVRDLDETGLRQWLEHDVPCCTRGGDRLTPGDPLNVVIVGSRDTVFPALARRGWHVTQTLSVTSLWRTIRSAVLGGRYRYAPVSPLYLFGRRQDMALQKGRRDVNQRNHMRLWLAPVTSGGRPVWVGQISRDIGVRLTRRTFTTHKIDPAVDETRWYLLQDLFFADALERFAFVGGVGVSRPQQPRTNFTGDPYVTDGRRAIFWLTPSAVASGRRVLPRWIPFRHRTAAPLTPVAERP